MTQFVEYPKYSSFPSLVNSGWDFLSVLGKYFFFSRFKNVPFTKSDLDDIGWLISHFPSAPRQYNPPSVSG